MVILSPVESTCCAVRLGEWEPTCLGEDLGDSIDSRQSHFKLETRYDKEDKKVERDHHPQLEEHLEAEEGGVVVVMNLNDFLLLFLHFLLHNVGLNLHV